MSQGHHFVLFLKTLQYFPNAFRLHSNFPPVIYHGPKAQPSVVLRASLQPAVPQSLYLHLPPLSSENRSSAFLPLGSGLNVSVSSSEELFWTPLIPSPKPCWLFCQLLCWFISQRLAPSVISLFPCSSSVHTTPKFKHSESLSCCAHPGRWACVCSWFWNHVSWACELCCLWMS